MLKRDVSNSTIYAVMFVELMVTNGRRNEVKYIYIYKKKREKKMKLNERNVDLVLRTHGIGVLFSAIP